MLLSIIIVNYNSGELLKKCLASIYRSLRKRRNNKTYSLSYEVIVVDNGSEEKLKAKDEQLKTIMKNLNLKLIENKKNLGFGRANNQGVKRAKGEYVLFLNPDIEVLDRGVEKLLHFIMKKRKIDVVGGKLYNQDMTPQASCGPFYSLPVVFLMLFLRGDKLGITRWSPQKIREVDWVSGACFLMRRKDFEALGGFDEKIFMYMEEVDLFYRAKKKGLRVFFYPGAPFIHLGAATSKSRMDPILNIYRGLLYFYKKHQKPWELFLLKVMLKTKAVIVYLVGFLTNNLYLKKTYAKAYKIVG